MLLFFLRRNLLIILLLLGVSGVYQSALCQKVALDDYKIFGRKAPITLGSSFGSLGQFAQFANPADLALVVDNRIAFSLATSGRGFGNHISFVGPNFSISSASQERQDENGLIHTKKLLTFAYGLSLGDPAPPKSKALTLGMAVNRKSDERGSGKSQALTTDLGLTFKMGASQINVTIQDLIISQESASNSKYPTRFIVGYRTRMQFGLRLAVQGLPGTGYGSAGESNFGFRIGLAQSFFNARLDSRLQLTSIFNESGEATMQEITAGVGYRRRPQKAQAFLRILLDIEFSYTLSFLAVPNIIGTHMFAIVKYF